MAHHHLAKEISAQALMRNNRAWASVLLVIAFALCASLLNLNVRDNQREVWLANQHITTIDSELSYSTADAPYFLHIAADIKRDFLGPLFFNLRSYPSNFDNPNAKQPFEIRDAPLLSVLIALLSKSAEPADLLNAAHAISVVTILLTSVSIVMAFGACGYWLEGAAAALGGGLSQAYLVRSSFGRIDTDQLNLGFLYLTFAITMFAARAKKPVATLAITLLGGVTSNVFLWWYGRHEFIWIALLALAWLLITHKRGIYLTISCCLIFFFTSGLSSPTVLSMQHFDDTLANGVFTFPNTFNFITELQKISFTNILRSTTGSLEMGLVGLCGLAAFALRHPVMAIAYAPLIAFSLLNFIFGNRVIFYSAPILWFGVAFILVTGFRVARAKMTENCAAVTGGRIDIPCIFAATLALAIAWVNSPVDYLPRPSFTKPVLQGFAGLKEQQDSKPPLVATWWDYGYSSMFLNRLPTLHDGGSQNTPWTHLLARALLSPNQQEMIQTLRYMSVTKQKALEGIKTIEALNRQINEGTHAGAPTIYLVLTNQMAGWMGSISGIGNWDIVEGKPIIPEGTNGKSEFAYNRLGCGYSSFPAVIDCNHIRLDLTKGMMNTKTPLNSWAQTENGFIRRAKTLHPESLLAVQTHLIDGVLNTELIHRALFESNFNQLFHLGTISSPEIRLVYDDYPNIRIFQF